MAKRSTKQQLLLSAISLLLCVSMLVGSTFAWFTDSVTSTNNIIKSGTLDVDLKYSLDMNSWSEFTSTTDLFSECLWEPGFTKVVYLRVSNIGTLALKYNLGINVFGNEIPGENVKGEEFKLSDYIYFDVIEDVEEAYANRDAARAAATDGVAIKAGYANGGKLLGKTDAKTEMDTVALVVYMPETVGNEANYRNGKQPSVNLGINLFATQVESEVDSFDENYDAEAGIKGTDTEIIVPGTTETAFSFSVYKDANNDNKIDEENDDKIASAEVPAEAVADGVTEVSFAVNETVYDGNFTIASGMETKSFDVTVTGLKDGNTTPVKVQLRIPAGLNPATVELYHKDSKIDCTYDPEDGFVTFKSATFSPFTVVYDAESVYVPPVIDDDDKLPEASVVRSSKYENIDLPWGSYGQWSPTAGLDSQLEAAYTFSCTETLEEAKQNPYANWYCDFVVTLDKDLGKDQIFLGGNYGSFGWVGFHNGDLTLDANTEIPLLGSVTSNPWTYLDVVQNVGTFICGVGDVDDALADATFKVMLRLTNPENESEVHNVAEISHKFTKTVYSGEELQDAINNGSSNIELGGDIDLNQGLVIPGI